MAYQGCRSTNEVQRFSISMKDFHAQSHRISRTDGSDTTTTELQHYHIQSQLVGFRGLGLSLRTCHYATGT